MPRILNIYDIDLPVHEVKAAVRQHFYDNKDIKDYRVQEMLVEQGYFSLETTMLQHKQKAHLMRFIEGYTVPMEAERKRLAPDATIDEQFARN
jgi:NADH dehydrogenase (ubiquinone) 1 alpha subcomplex subunit 6